MDTRLNTPWIALRFGLGLTAALAGLDTCFSLLADWGACVSPLAAQLLPFSADTFRTTAQLGPADFWRSA
jgi:hypothetical protein